ncbi:uncharacterized protein LOC105179083 [Sesamum indicum]|uniref:Uncharacterized protein LOC105179083 n=1 Tax=Sesamum indicum TaxID=4182 RepID=A0A6I9UH90_SESIN|nr:uncharacterized protein LOC105179083 [Sesamum indicum]
MHHHTRATTATSDPKTVYQPSKCEVGPRLSHCNPYTAKGHYPRPWKNISQIPQEHQLFWFNNLKEAQLRRPVKQMEVFENCYKKKDEHWSGPRVEEVSELFLTMMEESRNQQNSDQDPLLSSQGFVAPNEQHVWLSATGDRKRVRVFGLGSKAHHMIVGPSQPSMSTAPSCSPPQPSRPNRNDLIARLEEWMG